MTEKTVTVELTQNELALITSALLEAGFWWEHKVARTKNPEKKAKNEELARYIVKESHPLFMRLSAIRQAL